MPIFHPVLQIRLFWFSYLIDGSGVSICKTGSAFSLADARGLAAGGQCPSDAGLLCGLVKPFSSQFPRSVLLALSGVNRCSQKPSPLTCPLGPCPACRTTPIPEPAAHGSPPSWPCSARAFFVEQAVPKSLLHPVKPGPEKSLLRMAVLAVNVWRKEKPHTAVWMTAVQCRPWCSP